MFHFNWIRNFVCVEFEFGCEVDLCLVWYEIPFVLGLRLKRKFVGIQLAFVWKFDLCFV